MKALFAFSDKTRNTSGLARTSANAVGDVLGLFASLFKSLAAFPSPLPLKQISTHRVSIDYFFN
jgi:hypothetical protein